MKECMNKWLNVFQSNIQLICVSKKIWVHTIIGHSENSKKSLYNGTWLKKNSLG